MSFLDNTQAVIKVDKAEPRTSKSGKPYWLITDHDGKMWSQWDNAEGNEPLQAGKKYAVFYKISGDKNQYKTIVKCKEIQNG